MKEIASKRNNPKNERSAYMRLDYSIGPTPATFDMICDHVKRENDSNQIKLEAEAILSLRDKSDDWYGVSYLNAFFGAFILIPGAIWWSTGGPGWLFGIGLLQHGSAYITGYYSSEWRQEARDRLDKLMTIHNAGIATNIHSTQGISISFRF